MKDNSKNTQVLRAFTFFYVRTLCSRGTQKMKFKMNAKLATLYTDWSS